MNNNNDLQASIESLYTYSNQKKINQDQAFHIGKIINEYFSRHNRSQEFQGVDLLLINRFKEILKFYDMDRGISFTGLFFLFCYTLTKDYREVQGIIHDDLALPFRNWVMQKWAVFKSEVNSIPKGECYVYVCRHATVKGLYAPGMTTYTHIKTLIADGRNVSVIVLYDVADEFVKLETKYENLNIYKLSSSSNNLSRFKLLMQVLKMVRPKVIFTETEFDIISILSIMRPPVPIIYFSPGMYNLPWYDKICVTGNQLKNHIGNRGKDLFQVPLYLDMEILNPKVDLSKVESVKSKFGIKNSDFVIGQFARMEKFHDHFLELLIKVLDTVPTSKVLLAGPNDRGRVERALGQFVSCGRAIILPSSDTHVLGHCVDLGVDTFPTHSGYSNIEMMAKGIPIVSILDSEMNTSSDYHQADIYASDSNEALDMIISLACDRDFYNKRKRSTDAFMRDYDRGNEFLEKIDGLIEVFSDRKK